MGSILFRLGQFLLLGESSSYEEGLYGAMVRWLCTPDNKFEALKEAVELKVHERLVVSDSEEAPLGESSPGRETFESIARKVLVRHIVRGDLKGVKVSEMWKSPTLFASSEMALRLALEHHASTFRKMGAGPNIYESFDLVAPASVWMKKDPVFRDMTQIPEKTRVQIKAYENGCAVLEADNEKFWLPLESHGSNTINVDKDDDYYGRNQDADGDGVPDPLSMLPSKAGVGDQTVDRVDNWNQQPDLHHVDGDFAPTPKVGSEIPDLLAGMKESFGALQYEFDYRHFFPQLHGGSTGPAVEEDEMVEKIVDALMDGGDHSKLISERTDPDLVKRTFGEIYTKVFGTGPEAG